MKQLRYLVFGIVVSLLPFGLGACSKDDDKDNDTPSDTTNNSEGGHEYVDLGLASGTKWATCNIGASKPEEFGSYFAWGQTRTKDFYLPDNTYYELSYSELLTNWLDEVIEENGNLNALHDAAWDKFGSSWRMPTDAQMKELLSLPNEWTTLNNVTGVKFTGKNGNTLFLPAAGAREGRNLMDEGQAGYYWSSTFKETGLSYALIFIEGESFCEGNDNYAEFTVRAVLKQ